MSYRYTDREKETTRKLYFSYGPSVLAERFGRTPKAIAQLAYRMGLLNKRRWLTDRDKQIIVLLDGHIPRTYIAEILGISRGGLQRYCRSLGKNESPLLHKFNGKRAAKLKPSYMKLAHKLIGEMDA